MHGRGGVEDVRSWIKFLSNWRQSDVTEPLKRYFDIKNLRQGQRQQKEENSTWWQFIRVFLHFLFSITLFRKAEVIVCIVLHYTERTQSRLQFKNTYI